VPEVKPDAGFSTGSSFSSESSAADAAGAAAQSAVNTAQHMANPVPEYDQGSSNNYLSQPEVDFGRSSWLKKAIASGSAAVVLLLVFLVVMILGSDPCESVNCGAHGSCDPDGVCICTDGYSGPNCQDKPNLCEYPSHVRCGTHGSCSHGDCICTGGYTSAQVDRDCRNVAGNASDPCYAHVHWAMTVGIHDLNPAVIHARYCEPLGKCLTPNSSFGEFQCNIMLQSQWSLAQTVCDYPCDYPACEPGGGYTSAQTTGACGFGATICLVADGVKVTAGSPLADDKHKDRWIGNIGPDFEDALGVAEAKVHAQDTDGTTISFQIDCDTANECAGYQTQLVAQITHDACSTTDDGCDDGIFSEVCSADFVPGQTLSIKIMGADVATESASFDGSREVGCQTAPDPCQYPRQVSCGRHGSCSGGRCSCRNGYSGSSCQCALHCQDSVDDDAALRRDFDEVQRGVDHSDTSIYGCAAMLLHGACDLNGERRTLARYARPRCPHSCRSCNDNQGC
jgi:hypothetical protein